MPTSRETILTALQARLHSIPYVTVLRGGVLPERVPAAGLLIPRDGDLPGTATTEPETELQNSLPDLWAARLFVALCRKHEVKSYRYPRQRRTTVMVRVRQAEFERTIAAEFRSLHRELTGYFSEMVNHLIANVMKSDGDDETLEQRQIGQS